MGRVNFDESIHDRKGITEKVELVRGKQSAELKNWTVYSFPVDYSFVQDKRYKNGKINDYKSRKYSDKSSHFLL